jgi:hypothetical protein
MNKRLSWPPVRWTVTFTLFLLILSGCTIKLVADYDEQTDRSVTELQRKLETFFVKLERQIGTPDADYVNYQTFYDGVKVDISAIKLRVSAIPKNQITLKQIELLEDNLATLEQLHQAGITDIQVVKVVRDDFNTALTSILSLELAKKRGE